MAKKQKMIYIEEDLVKRLDNINGSQLISELLSKHFAIADIATDPEQMKKRIKELEIKQDYENKIKELYGRT